MTHTSLWTSLQGRIMMVLMTCAAVVFGVFAMALAADAQVIPTIDFGTRTDAGTSGEVTTPPPTVSVPAGTLSTRRTISARRPVTRTRRTISTRRAPVAAAPTQEESHEQMCERRAAEWRAAAESQKQTIENAMIEDGCNRPDLYEDPRETCAYWQRTKDSIYNAYNGNMAALEGEPSWQEANRELERLGCIRRDDVGGTGTSSRDECIGIDGENLCERRGDDVDGGSFSPGRDDARPVFVSPRRAPTTVRTLPPTRRSFGDDAGGTGFEGDPCIGTDGENLCQRGGDEPAGNRFSRRDDAGPTFRSPRLGQPDLTPRRPINIRRDDNDGGDSSDCFDSKLFVEYERTLEALAATKDPQERARLSAKAKALKTALVESPNCQEEFGGGSHDDFRGEFDDDADRRHDDHGGGEQCNEGLCDEYARQIAAFEAQLRSMEQLLATMKATQSHMCVGGSSDLRLDRGVRTQRRVRGTFSSRRPSRARLGNPATGPSL